MNILFLELSHLFTLVNWLPNTLSFKKNVTEVSKTSKIELLKVFLLTDYMKGTLSMNPTKGQDS